MQRPTVVLPEPDSPTKPSVSPSLMSNETPSTALTSPTWRLKTPAMILKYLATSRSATSVSALTPSVEAVGLSSAAIWRLPFGSGGGRRLCGSAQRLGVDIFIFLIYEASRHVPLSEFVRRRRG